MYTTPQSGPATTAIVAPTPDAATAAVTAYRTTLLGLIISNPLFTEAEQLRANHNAHECHDPATLAKWVRNTSREADRRRENPPARYATGTQRETIVRLLNHPKVTRSQKTGTLLNINRLNREQAAELITKLQLLTGAKAAPGQQLDLPALRTYAVRPTGKADRTAAARFLPASSLTAADFATLPTSGKASPHLTAYAATGTGPLRPARAGEFVHLTLCNN